MGDGGTPKDDMAVSSLCGGVETPAKSTCRPLQNLGKAGRGSISYIITQLR